MQFGYPPEEIGLRSNMQVARNAVKALLITSADVLTYSRPGGNGR